MAPERPATPRARPVSAALIGESAAMQALRRDVERLALSDVTVLVTGPTGSGKENVARALHAGSARAGRPFVAVNCGAIPAHLAEAELFGHEAGAFTGATRARGGRIEAADGGTLFLDELGELSLDVQAKLLRAVETGEVERLGGGRPIAVDVRIVAATHRDLEAMAAEGHFRADLYWRLAVAFIDVPPLAERTADIAALVAHFLGGEAEGAGPVLAPSGLAMLEAHGWPGNVRELRNLLDRARALGEPLLDRETVARLLAPRRRPIADWMAAGGGVGAAAGGDGPDGAGPLAGRSLADVPLKAGAELRPLVLKALLAEAEEAIIHQALAGGGSIADSARMLGLKRTTLVEKMRRMGIAAPVARRA